MKRHQHFDTECKYNLVAEASIKNGLGGREGGEKSPVFLVLC